MRTHTKTFHIRFTEEEYARLCKYAKKAGLPKTTYIRHMINGCHPKERPPDSYFPLLSELHRVGNDISSYSYKAYRFGGVHKERLDKMTVLFAETLNRIQEEVQWLGKLDVPATLERGRLLAEAEQNEEKDHE